MDHKTIHILDLYNQNYIKLQVYYDRNYDRNAGVKAKTEKGEEYRHVIYSHRLKSFINDDHLHLLGFDLTEDEAYKICEEYLNSLTNTVLKSFNKPLINSKKVMLNSAIYSHADSKTHGELDLDFPTEHTINQLHAQQLMVADLKYTLGCTFEEAFKNISIKL